jgi:hypothetical protein
LLLFVTTIYRTASIIPSYIRIDLASLIPKKVSNMEPSFKQFHDVAEVTIATPDTTTPKHTYSTPESGGDYDATVYVCRNTAGAEVSNCI